jgi:uncharacterized protein YndB with AHSA1/START domain
MAFEPLVIEKTLNAPAPRVWKAITDAGQMKRWYFDIPDFRPEVGFEFEFTVEHEGKVYTHLCKVNEADFNKKLSYSWRYSEYPGDSEVTFELFTEGDKTRLKLTHKGLHTFPSDNPDFGVASFTAGWNEIIGKSLPEYLEKEVVG